MRLRMALAAGLLLACGASAGMAQAAADPAAQAANLTNRQIVERFIDLFYRQGRVREAFETYVHEDYIQHNPLAPDGRAAAWPGTSR